ncbi:hypothetical protein [Sinobacterium caligoides]|nr:hypothetical protein [Sinobacterium caligoides]
MNLLHNHQHYAKPSDHNKAWRQHQKSCCTSYGKPAMSTVG